MAAAPAALDDGQIGATLDHDFHAEACAVLEISPDPQNSFEIAVVLSTLGYTDAEAAALGCRDLFDMAERIYEIVEIYFRTPIDDTPPELLRERMRRNMRYLLRGFSYVELWVLSLLLLWVNRASFWSGGTLTELHATAISAALIYSSILTAPVIQSYTRRYLFYSLQGNAPLARWVTSRVLYCGAALVYGVLLATWFVMEHVLGALTPNTNLEFLAFALLLASLQLVFAPLVATRSAVALSAAVLSGAVVLLVLQPASWVAAGRRQATLHPPGRRDRHDLRGVLAGVAVAAPAVRRTAARACPAGPATPRQPASASRSRPTRSTASSSSPSCSPPSCSPAAPSGCAITTGPSTKARPTWPCRSSSRPSLPSRS